MLRLQDPGREPGFCFTEIVCDACDGLNAAVLQRPPFTTTKRGAALLAATGVKRLGA